MPVTAILAPGLAALALLLGCASDSDAPRVRPPPAASSEELAAEDEPGSAASRTNGESPAAAEEAPETPVAEGADASAAASFPPPWCERTGPEGGARIDTVIGIADNYWFDLSNDCETAGLTDAFSSDQGMEWLGYLTEYTYLLTGCPLEGAQPTGGGLAVFGLANTPVVGGTRGPLGRGDANLLIDKYVVSFGDGLQLTPAERETLRAYLQSSAEPEIDPLASATLSTCGQLP